MRSQCRSKKAVMLVILTIGLLLHFHSGGLLIFDSHSILYYVLYGVEPESRVSHSSANCTRIGCTFSHVCLTVRGDPIDWDGTPSIDLFYYLEDGSKIDFGLPVVASRSNNDFYDIPVHVHFINDSIPLTGWNERPAVLLDYFEAENFGHHLLDMWLQYFTIQNMLRPHPIITEGDLVLVRSCNNPRSFRFAREHKIEHKLIEEFQQSCRALERIFSNALLLKEVHTLARDSPKCFRTLSVGRGSCPFYSNCPDGTRPTKDSDVDSFCAALREAAESMRTDQSHRNTLILTKSDATARTLSHWTAKQAEEVAGLILRSGGVADVRKIPSSSTVFEQIKELASYGCIITPGGGAGFLAYFVQPNTTVLVAAYTVEKDMKVFEYGSFKHVRYLGDEARRSTFNASHIYFSWERFCR